MCTAYDSDMSIPMSDFSLLSLPNLSDLMMINNILLDETHKTDIKAQWLYTKHICHPHAHRSMPNTFDYPSDI